MLLEDLAKLEGNTAWLYFLNHVKKEAFKKLESCGKEEYTHDKIKYWQGAYRALKKVYENYPDDISKEIQEEIKE